jgi:hypothetical protein
MKTIILLISLSTFGFAFGQKLSADLNIGGQFNDVQNGFTANLGIAYKISPVFALRFDVGNAQFGKNSLTRTTLHALVDLTRAIKEEEMDFALVVHAGFGTSNRSNKNLYNDRYLLVGDDMTHLAFGLTPSIKVNEKLRFQIDASYFTYFKQDGSFPYSLNTTAGLSYTF